ncbi:2-amino-4-hydroxy-6-hydroxymethyldihydropteridine diphosphokinase [Sulfurospirillum halorespirans]|uniref:2-amino-4-hydroxy-6-hydroxymethyldihydropteridine pyrophosphokinase n=1 Tax=Sulfurospirillum halorespirans DSM 13726 TaxID=1193502 RepID=A0A1D7TH51_9BACT|nr:2-amino-4-hydroxy-6-hydroxymethyldihydropteridine diphosphokinase [Sulfurospirillum halorespirans]AOO64174.1 2-amino-4-hydroxy-6- hydroxymethyldihydropteridine pyrophosphokinase [Sulfurospirillum halorespirans DSM 13726]
MKLERIRFFPTCKRAKPHFSHRAVIGLGGNQGDVKKRFVKLYRIFLNDSRFYIQKSSMVFQNPPFGYLDQPDFYNAIIVLQTSLRAKALLKVLLHVEHIFGRVRLFKNGPRTLDLDIIFFDNQKIHQPNLIVPHPKWSERASVIVPLFTLKSFKG